MRNGVEHQTVVVPHVGCAVGACFEVRGRCQHRQIEAMTLAEPPILGLDRLQPFLVTHRNTTQHLPVEERTKRTHPRVAAQSREAFANQIHVGFRHAHVQRARLIDSRHARLEAARRAEIRIDRNHARVAREHLHRGRDDVACGVLFSRIDFRKGSLVVTDSLIARGNAPQQHRPHLRAQFQPA